MAVKEISIKWSTIDVQEVRPDLTDGQAWQVLKRVEKNHDCSIGINWETLEIVADDIYPFRSNDDNEDDSEEEEIEIEEDEV